MPLNALNIGAQLSLAPGNERNRSEPFVQQEGVYTALCSETMMVITQTKRLELPNMNVIKNGLCIYTLSYIHLIMTHLDPQ